jgi:DNA-binding transcriptional ArsR family regulator
MADDIEEVFDRAAELFAVLSTPIRLRIIKVPCHGEKNARQLLSQIDVAQPNMSQLMNIMYRSGIWGKRRHGAQMFYRFSDPAAAGVCWGHVNASCHGFSHELTTQNEEFV